MVKLFQKCNVAKPKFKTKNTFYFQIAKFALLNSFFRLFK